MANMLTSKSGKMGGNTIEKYMYLFIIVVILLKVIAQLLPEAQTAGTELNATGAPLGSFFTSDGIVWLIVMASVVFLMIRSFMAKK